eukprot:Colp12_sorted_trinity150504_noHs@21753
MDWEDESDVWLIDSLKSYKSLHMYDLPEPASAIAIANRESVVVASAAQKRSTHEVHVYALPSNLIDHDPLNDERDLDLVKGVFTPHPLCDIMVAESRLVAGVSTDSDDVWVWHVGGEESDLLSLHAHVILPPTPHPTTLRSVSGSLGAPHLAAVGGTLGHLFLVDVEKGSPVRKLDAKLDEKLEPTPIMGLHSDSVSAGVMYAVGETGELAVLDTREKRSHVASLGHRVDSCDVRGPVVCAATGAGVHVHDLRGRVGDKLALNRTHTSAVATRDGKNVCGIKISPHTPSLISISEASGLVSIFDTAQWDSDHPSPRFVHRGHTLDGPTAPRAHTWHPDLGGVVMSGADDGSFHIWKPADHLG